MKIAIMTLAAVLALPTIAHGKDSCTDPQDQATLNQCASNDVQASDKRLNALYRQIRDRLKEDTDTRTRLVQAQREWIKFRDAECAFQTALADGGSIMPMLVAQCIESLTKARIQDFERYLNCQEGDLSCPVPNAATQSNTAPAAEITTTARAASSSNDDMSLDVTVKLSDKAAAHLATKNEAIVVYASYYGEPTKSARSHANEVGQISLSSADEHLQIPGTGGHAHISGTRIVTDRLSWVTDPIKVNVNVASARKSSSDNLLDCDFIDGPVADARKRSPVTLHCYLIQEQHPDTQLRP